MARRRYKRYRSQRKPQVAYYPREAEPGALEAVGLLLVAAAKGIAWGVRWLVRRARAKQALPPPLPVRAASVSMPQATPPIATPPTLPTRVVTPQPLRYRRRRHLVSKGERAFWHPLYYAVRGKYRIFCKVRLLDVIEPAGGRHEARRLSGSIGRYHVDFVLCDPQTTAPLLVIELDDKSHRSLRQAERDRFKDEVLAAAGVPMYRVPAQQAYDPIDLADEIARRM